MTAVDNTDIVLYRYLRALSVKVSRSTVLHLLDTSEDNDMQSISDALNVLNIKNEVCQLPPSPDYFFQLSTPFITILQMDRSPCCVVTKKDDFIVEFSDAKGKKYYVKTHCFLKRWTGTVLFGETTGRTPSESFYRWKNISFRFLNH
jgi:ABC-type bacteriocin/lantibiotic exporter with double-glycine peptidase domain